MSRTRPRALGRDYRLLWTSSLISNFGDGLSIVAYPWLASALTRDPIAISGVLIATRLPWLLFTLPAGVITDRNDRRRLVVAMDLARFAITVGVAVAVIAGQNSLPDPRRLADGLENAPSNATVALVLLYGAALLLGFAEVLRDNAAQTMMPSVVDDDQLERANGRLWGAEMAMNSFVGPPVAGLLLGVSFALPFIVDAGTFAAAAALLAMLGGNFLPKTADAEDAEDAEDATRDEAPSFRDELRAGFSWLWQHRFLRSLAISLGFLNGLLAAAAAAEVLFAQEVLGLSATTYGILAMSHAIGGIVGSLTADRITEVIRPGAALFATILMSAITQAIVGALPVLWIVFVSFALGSYTGTIWNVITVSLRQTLIPDHLLGRVNSCYRFFGWGMIPIGTLLGGVVIAVSEQFVDREMALRVPFFIAAVGLVALYVWTRPRLNTAEIDRAKKAAGLSVTG